MGTKEKSPKQGITRAEDLTIELPERSESQTSVENRTYSKS